MRAIVSVSSDASEWFEHLEASKIRDLVGRIQKSVVLITPDMATSELLKTLQGLPEPFQSLIVGLIQETPKGVKSPELVIDLHVGMDDNEIKTFDTEIEVIADLVSQRGQIGVTSERSQEVFARTIGTLAQASKRVEIFDRYFASTILTEKHWPVSQLLKIRHLHVDVVSGVTLTDREKEIAEEDRAAKVQDAWQKLLTRNRPGNNSSALSKLTLIRVKRGHLRNRFMIFYFADNKAILLGLPHGLGDFSSERLREETMFPTEQKPERIKEVISSWQDTARFSLINVLQWQGEKLNA